MEILVPNYSENEYLERIRQLFNESNVVDITSLFNESFIKRLQKEALKVYSELNVRRDFNMKFTDNTPRNMYSVSESNIDKASTIIPRFYNDENVLKLLSLIAEEELFTLPVQGEHYVINGLSKVGDTHGWHWDDYSYSVVFIVQAPDENSGGEVECVPNVNWNKDEPNVTIILNENLIHSYYFKSGSFYLLKSHVTMHRVSPLLDDSKPRIAIAMSWCNSSDLNREIDASTVIELYGN